MKHILSLLLVLGLVAAAEFAAARPKRQEPLLGGYQLIKNVKDPYVVEIGKFAISEHNKKSKSNLVFVEVVSGEQQVVAGMNYRLVIAAKDGVTGGSYQALVYDKPWQKVRELKSFQEGA